MLTSYKITSNFVQQVFAKISTRSYIFQELISWATEGSVKVGSNYQADYRCQGENDDMQLPVMHVFHKIDG
jgi:hypothetical protein